MPPINADLGTGASFSMLTSKWTGEITSIKRSGGGRASIETTHLLTPPALPNEIGSKPFIPGKLSDAGEIQISVRHNPDNEPPNEGAAEDAEITYPVPAGLTNPARRRFSCFVTKVEDSIELESLMETTLTLKITGPIRITQAT